MMEPNDDLDPRTSRLLQGAMVLVAVGLILVLVFLIAGFRSWSVGLGMFLGMPMLFLGMLLYIVCVVLDLKKHGVFRSSAEPETE